MYYDIKIILSPWIFMLFALLFSINVSADIIEYECDQKNTLKSPASVNDSDLHALTFKNSSSNSIKTIWIDPNGINNEYSTIASGGIYTQQTYPNDIWMITDLGGNCLKIIANSNATAQIFSFSDTIEQTSSSSVASSSISSSVQSSLSSSSISSSVQSSLSLSSMSSSSSSTTSEKCFSIDQMPFSKEISSMLPDAILGKVPDLDEKYNDQGFEVQKCGKLTFYIQRIENGSTQQPVRALMHINGNFQPTAVTPLLKKIDQSTLTDTIIYYVASNYGIDSNKDKNGKVFTWPASLKIVIERTYYNDFSLKEGTHITGLVTLKGLTADILHAMGYPNENVILTTGREKQSPAWKSVVQNQIDTNGLNYASSTPSGSNNDEETLYINLAHHGVWKNCAGIQGLTLIDSTVYLDENLVFGFWGTGKFNNNPVSMFYNGPLKLTKKPKDYLEVQVGFGAENLNLKEYMKLITAYQSRYLYLGNSLASNTTESTATESTSTEPTVTETAETQNNYPARTIPKLNAALARTNVNSNWKILPILNKIENPVIISGVPSANGGPGVIRQKPEYTTINYNGELQEKRTDAFITKFQEWQYLDGKHVYEEVSFLALPEGIHKLGDTIVEAGTFELSELNNYKSVNFQSTFSSAPLLLLSVQSYNGSDPIIVRAKNVTASGFKAKIQEEEATQNSGHVKETIGYVAIYLPKTRIKLRLIDNKEHYLTGYKLNVTHEKNNVIWLDEESSLDEEIAHNEELVDYLTIKFPNGREAIFAQIVSQNGDDPVGLRRR